MKAKMIQVRSDGMRATAWEVEGKLVTPSYPLNIEMDENRNGYMGTLHLCPPLEKGHIHCIIPVNYSTEVVGPYINITSEEAIALGKKLIAIGKKYAHGKIHTKETK